MTLDTQFLIDRGELVCELHPTEKWPHRLECPCGLPKDEAERQILRNARDLIAKPENWCQEALEKNMDGVIAYCAIAALKVACGERATDCRSGAWKNPARLLANVVGWPSIVTYNNSQPHERVLAAFDAAIAQTATFSSREDSCVSC